MSDRFGICTQDLLTQKPVFLKDSQPCVPQEASTRPRMTSPKNTSVKKQKPGISGRLRAPDHSFEFVFTTVYGIWGKIQTISSILSDWIKGIKQKASFLPFHRVSPYRKNSLPQTSQRVKERPLLLLSAPKTKSWKIPYLNQTQKFSKRNSSLGLKSIPTISLLLYFPANSLSRHLWQTQGARGGAEAGWHDCKTGLENVAAEVLRPRSGSVSVSSNPPEVGWDSKKQRTLSISQGFLARKIGYPTAAPTKQLSIKQGKEGRAALWN